MTMIKHKYKRPVHLRLRPMVADDFPKSRDMQQCVWCGARAKKNSQFCSNECERNYVTRANVDDLRLLIQERDVNICSSCGKRDPHYVISPCYPVEKGGGAPGLDWTRTLCEQCHLDKKDMLTEDQVQEPPLPDTSILRRKWRSIKRRWKSYRYTLGPLFLSCRMWEDAHTDYRNGNYAMAKTCAFRNRDHYRQLIITLRWWQMIANRHKNPHEILTYTLKSLQEQIEACRAWQQYWRERGIGALD